jgi:hypothetical protein
MGMQTNASSTALPIRQSSLATKAWNASLDRCAPLTWCSAGDEFSTDAPFDVGELLAESDVGMLMIDFLFVIGGRSWN